MNVAVLLSRQDTAIKAKRFGGTNKKNGPVRFHRAASLLGERGYQLTRFQVWPPQNMPPKAQPWTRREAVPFIAIVES